METIVLKESTTSTYQLEDGILYMRVKEGADITLEAAIEGAAVRKQMQQGEKVLLLVDLRKVGQVHRDARAYAAKKEIDEMNKAMGMVTGKSLAARIIGNFYIKFNKPNTPTKLFKTEERALTWLKTHR